jgi:prophage regulatory protein
MSNEMLEVGTVERRILRRPEVETRIGFKRSHIYKLMNAGKFPKAKRIGIRTVGWDSAEIDQWIAERLQQNI